MPPQSCCAASNRRLDQSTEMGLLSLLFALARHDLDLVCLNTVLIVQLELHILDNERPDFITETICIQMSLYGPSATPRAYTRALS